MSAIYKPMSEKQYNDLSSHSPTACPVGSMATTMSTLPDYNLHHHHPLNIPSHDINNIGFNIALHDYNLHHPPPLNILSHDINNIGFNMA
jgi:hypothetical protein